MSEPTDPLAPDGLTPTVNSGDAGASESPGAQPPVVRSQFRVGQSVPFRPSWTLVKELGRGGFGEVWQAKHEWRKELGAVKFCTHPDARVQLVSHEKKVIVRIMRYAGDHPHIVPLFDYDLSGDVPWLMFEYVEGGTLVHAIEQWRELPLSRRLGRAVVTLYGIARALKRVHLLDPPIVHRDLKPANVLMTRWLPRVTDFGISGAAGRATGTTDPSPDLSVQLPTMLKSMGTFRYASPEQMLGSTPDPRDDVYALGIIAYQMVLGDTNAVPGTDAADIMRELQVPKDFISLVVRSVAMDPARRPRDAREWEKTLRAWVPKMSDPATSTEMRPLPTTPQVIREEPRTPSFSPSAVTHTNPPPVPAPTPVLSPTPAPRPETISITVPGVLLARPATESGTAWKEVGKLPATIELVPSLVYCIRARETITDAELEGVRSLFDFAPVRHLNLSWCAQLTDAALAHLTDATTLRGLDLVGCKRVTDAGLIHLQSLTTLKHLSLRWCTLVTDAGIARLKKLAALRHLDLMGCGEVTDAALGHVRSFPRLRHLNLRWCEQVTDAGLLHLAKLTRLQSLVLASCTRPTEAGVAALKVALPQCEIER